MIMFSQLLSKCKVTYIVVSYAYKNNGANLYMVYFYSLSSLIYSLCVFVPQKWIQTAYTGSEHYDLYVYSS